MGDASDFYVSLLRGRPQTFIYPCLSRVEAAIQTPRKNGFSITHLLGILLAKFCQRDPYSNRLSCRVCVVAIVRITTLNAIDYEDITSMDTVRHDS